MTNKIIVGLLVAVLFTACVTERKRQRICNSCPEKIKVDSIVTTTIKDTTILDTIVTPADSAWYKALIKCRDGSQPVISQPKQKKGKRTSISVSIDTLGILTANCKADSLQSVIERQNKIIERIVRVTQEKTIKERDTNRFGWVGTLGLCMLVFVLCFIIGYVARLK